MAFCKVIKLHFFRGIDMEERGPKQSLVDDLCPNIGLFCGMYLDASGLIDW
jgi:hypothetical protein